MPEAEGADHRLAELLPHLLQRHAHEQVAALGAPARGAGGGEGRAAGGREAPLLPQPVPPDPGREPGLRPEGSGRDQPVQERLQGAGRLPLRLGEADEAPRHRQRHVHLRFPPQRRESHPGQQPAGHRGTDEHAGDADRHRRLRPRAQRHPGEAGLQRPARSLHPGHEALPAHSADQSGEDFLRQAQVVQRGRRREPLPHGPERSGLRRLPPGLAEVRIFPVVRHQRRRSGCRQLRPLHRARRAGRRSRAHSGLRRLSLHPERGDHRVREAERGVPAVPAHPLLGAPEHDLPARRRNHAGARQRERLHPPQVVGRRRDSPGDARRAAHLPLVPPVRRGGGRPAADGSAPGGCVV